MPETQETWIQSLGREDPLEEEIATSFLASKMSMNTGAWWTAYSPWGFKESDTTEQPIAHKQVL